MKLYVSDAVAFFHYLLDDLPPEAGNAFREAEEGSAKIYMPTIAAAELFYLFKKKRRMRLWSRIKDQAANEENPIFQYYPFDEQVLELFEKTKVSEIHDRIIVSTAKLTKSDAIITKDKAIKDSKEVKTLW